MYNRRYYQLIKSKSQTDIDAETESTILLNSIILYLVRLCKMKPHKFYLVHPSPRSVTNLLATTLQYTNTARIPHTCPEKHWCQEFSLTKNVLTDSACAINHLGYHLKRMLRNLTVRFPGKAIENS